MYKIMMKLNYINNQKFELIIIDGYDDTLNEIVSFCDKNAIVL